MNNNELTSAEYFQIGIGYFNTGDYDRAAEAFQEASVLNPYSRDALLNLVQSLYSRALELDDQEESPDRNVELANLYDQILDAAEAVQAFDPLNRNLISFMLRSLRGKAEIMPAPETQWLTRQTQDLYRVYMGQKYEVASISLRFTSDDKATVTGTLTNLRGTANEGVRLRFALLGHSGSVLDTQDVEIRGPSQGKATEFSLDLGHSGREVAGWKYERVGEENDHG